MATKMCCQINGKTILLAGWSTNEYKLSGGKFDKIKIINSGTLPKIWEMAYIQIYSLQRHLKNQDWVYYKNTG